MNKLNQRGFGPAIVILILLVIGLVGFAGFRIANDNTQIADSGTSQQSEVTTIKSTEDVETADKELDATDVDSGMNDRELDADIEALL